MKNISSTTKAFLAAAIVLGVNTAGAVSAFADTTSSNSTNSTGGVSVSVVNNASNTGASGTVNATANGVVNGTANGTASSSVSSTTNTDATSAGMLPGSFFYFLKTTIENIRLMLTFNDVNKANLLAQYAQQRISEANALIAKGNMTLAQTTLQQAVQDENQALVLAMKNGSSTIDFNSTGNNAVSASGNNSTSNDSNSANNALGNSSDNGAAANGSDTNISSNSSDNSLSNASAGNAVSNDANTAGNDANGTGNDANVAGEDMSEHMGIRLGEDPRRDAIFLHLGQDALALTNALQHVKNPKAQSAIEANIEKSLAHLQNQLQMLAQASAANGAMFGNDGGVVFGQSPANEANAVNMVGNVSTGPLGHIDNTVSNTVTQKSQVVVSTLPTKPVVKKGDDKKEHEKTKKESKFGTNTSTNVTVSVQPNQQANTTRAASQAGSAAAQVASEIQSVLNQMANMQQHRESGDSEKSEHSFQGQQGGQWQNQNHGDDNHGGHGGHGDH